MCQHLIDSADAAMLKILRSTILCGYVWKAHCTVCLVCRPGYDIRLEVLGSMFYIGANRRLYFTQFVNPEWMVEITFAWHIDQIVTHAAHIDRFTNQFRTLYGYYHANLNTTRALERILDAHVATGNSFVTIKQVPNDIIFLPRSLW